MRNEPRKSRRRERQKISRDLEQWLKILSVILISLIAFETLAVATAMPYIAEDLDGLHLYSLASGIPLTAQLVTTALCGPWADRRGPKQPLAIGSVLFILGLVIAAFAPTIELVVLGRAVQGLGGGLMVVPLYVLVGAHVPAQRQPAIFAAFAAAWVIPSLIGPAIAGFLVDYVNWRAVFAIVPVLLILLGPLFYSKFKLFPDTHDPRASFRPDRTFWFALAVGISIGALQILSGAEEDSQNAGFYIGVIVASLAAFTLVRPLMPAGTLRARRGVPSAILLRGSINGAYIGTEIFLVLMLKEVHGWDATVAGLVMAAGSITWAIGSWVQGRIISPSGRKLLPIVGTILQLIGTAITLLGAFESLSGLWVILGWLVAGMGVGLVYPAMTVAALAQTPKEKHGAISSAIQIADTMGSSICVAYAGIAFALAQGMNGPAFIVTIGLMIIVLILAVWVSTRVEGRSSSNGVSQASVPEVTDSAVTPEPENE